MREVEPTENYKLAFEFAKLESKAEELREKKFLESIEGSIPKLR